MGLAAALRSPKYPGLRRAHFNARRELALGDPVVAEGALVGGVGRRVEIPRAVRARLDAVPAPDARLLVDEDDAVRGLEGRPDGAHLDARRVRALVAQLRDEEGAQDRPVGRRLGRRLIPGAIALTIVWPFFRVMYRSTQVRTKNGSFGTLFSFLQASMHRAQPMHLSTETPYPYHFPVLATSLPYAFGGMSLRTPSIAPPERRTAKNPLRKLLRPFTVPPPGNGDNGIASRRTSRRARPC